MEEVGVAEADDHCNVAVKAWAGEDVELTTATLFCVYIGVKFSPFTRHSELNPDSFLGTIRTRFRNNANKSHATFHLNYKRSSN